VDLGPRYNRPMKDIVIVDRPGPPLRSGGKRGVASRGIGGGEGISLAVERA
jgi:hypothetical protein